MKPLPDNEMGADAEHGMGHDASDGDNLEAWEAWEERWEAWEERNIYISHTDPDADIWLNDGND